MSRPVPVVFRPQAPAVSLDDGPADGKTHTKSVPFGGIERLKNLVELVAIQARSSVTHRHL